MSRPNRAALLILKEDTHDPIRHGALMAAAELDLDVEQYADFTKLITIKDEAGAIFPLTGYTAKMEIRKDYGAPIVATSPGQIGLAIDGAAGTIIISIDNLITAAFAGDLSYDLVIINAGVVSRILKGRVRTEPGITVYP